MNPPGNGGIGSSSGLRGSLVGSIGSPPGTRFDSQPSDLMTELAQAWQRDQPPRPPIEETFSNLHISPSNYINGYPSSSRPRLHHGYEVHGYRAESPEAAYNEFLYGFTDPSPFRQYHRQPAVQPHRNSLNLRMRAPDDDLVTRATNHRTSRWLQYYIPYMTRAQIDGYFLEFIDNIEKMMSNSAASLVSQTLIEAFTEDQIRTILRILCTKLGGRTLRQLCLDTHGRKTVEKLLPKITDPHHKGLLMDTLQKHTLQLVKHEEGHKIIELCLKIFSDKENWLILTEVARNCVGIATNKMGYRILSRIIEGYRGGKYESVVLNQIIVNAASLSSDPYGNFVVQNLLELRKFPQCTSEILLTLRGDLYDLSLSKFGSHVVQKCLKMAYPFGQLAPIIDELINPSQGPSLFLDNFGNYVMQTALEQTMVWNLQPSHQVLLDHLRNVAPRLRSVNFGRRLLRWLPRSSFFPRNASPH